MASTLANGLTAATQQARFDSIIQEFVSALRREGVADGYIGQHPGPARHFLTWLVRRSIPLRTVDGTVLDCFLQHDCDCCYGVPAAVLLHPWRKRRSSPEVMQFVRFPERTGRIEQPGDLDDNLRILDAFLERLRGDGFARETMRAYRSAGAGLIAWLHLSRIRLRDLNPEVLARFRQRQVACSIPGVFPGQRTQSLGTCYGTEVRGFLRYLAETGRINPVEPAPHQQAFPERLEWFRTWLARQRGIRAASTHRHAFLMAAVLPALGDDPRAYDAARIRRVLFEHIERRSRSYARRLASAMRMYLRFLVSEGRVPGTLAGAVPTVPQWRWPALPRYIPAADVERAILSCGQGPVGLRDRAILRLLARLALRAGDIVALRLGDIDWDRALLRVSGKSPRESQLPLPQDAGDALLAYITTVRPQVRQEAVFLRARAPYRPFTGPAAVSSIARRALDRAKVTTSASRGAHVFRHSQATGLLRSGASLDVIGALLRHDGRDTTMIYAKTDAGMLQQVAQPWIGGLER